MYVKVKESDYVAIRHSVKNVHVLIQDNYRLTIST